MMEVPKIVEKCTTKNPKYSKANTQVTSEKCAKFKKENDSKTTLKNQTNRNCKRPYPGVSKFFLPEKRARKLRTPKFLLGGSISDPLNLHSLQNESELNDENDPADPQNDDNVIELIIPPNLCDPLGLSSVSDEKQYEKQLTCNKGNKNKRQRKRLRKQSFSIKPTTSPVKKKNVSFEDPNDSKDETKDESSHGEEGPEPKKIESPEKTVQKSKDINRVSPVAFTVTTAKPSTSTTEEAVEVIPEVPVPETVVEPEVVDEKIEEVEKVEEIKSEVEAVVKGKELEPIKLRQDARCQYGNYNRYWGYESLNKNIDVRLKIFRRHVHLFKNKDVLDIGCNVGLMTLAIAKHLSPKSIVGVDIDKSLIGLAKNKLCKYVRVPEAIGTANLAEDNNTKFRNKVEFFPISFPICYGNLNAALRSTQKTPAHILSPNFSQPSTPQTPQTTQIDAQHMPRMPDNVSFEQMDYVPKDEITAAKDKDKYDLILLLSVTKWMHLNNGDNGLKLTFKKIFNQLRLGGKMILEMQNWPSYKKKRKMTEKIFENYQGTKFPPADFTQYLLSQEVGFSHYYTLGVTQHLSKGFKRPIYLFVKGDFTPNRACKWSFYFPSTTPYENKKQVYDNLRMNKYAPLPFQIPMASPCNPYRPSQASTSQLPSPNDPTYDPNRLFPGHLGTPGRTPGYSGTPPNRTPYYNPQQSDYWPSYDNDLPRAHVFMSPFSSFSPSPSSSKRSCDDDQQSQSPSNRHLYHLISDPPPKSSTTPNRSSNDETK